jgi:hypothetical protein
MWKPWELATSSNDRAVANARAAATELSRARVERVEVETYLEGLADRYAETGVTGRPA